MNIDTDLQFAFTEGIRDYDQNIVQTQIVLKIGGADVPNKKKILRSRNGYEKVK
jgi:fructose/tagatose bisphosphate aldolase